MSTTLPKSEADQIGRKGVISDASLNLQSFIFWMSRQAYHPEVSYPEDGKHLTFSGGSQYGGGVPNYFTPIVDTRKIKKRVKRALKRDEFLKLLAAEFVEELGRVASNLTNLAEAIGKEYYDGEHVDIVELRIDPLPYDDEDDWEQ